MPAPALFLLALTYLGFVSLGLPDAVLGVAWPSVHRHFGLPAGHLGAVLTASAAGYLVSSALTGRALQRLGVGGLLAASTGVVTLSLVGFALAPAFGVFVASGVLAGLGAGAIDAGLNTHASRHFSARQMNWLHACWGVGATLGAMTAAAVIARGLPWQGAYGLLAGVMAALSVTFALTVRAWRAPVGAAAEGPPAPAERPSTMGEALRHPRVWGQVGVFFLYCGVEITTGTWAFALLTQHRGVSTALAGTAVTLYWSSLTAGRFALGAIADRFGVERLVGLAATGALVGTLTFVLAPWPWLAAAGLATLGVSLAPIYPGMMTLTPRRLGRLADHAVGFQVGAAMLGSVAVPSLGGLVMQALGPAWLSGMLGVTAGLLWGAIVGLFRGGDRLETAYRNPS